MSDETKLTEAQTEEEPDQNKPKRCFSFLSLLSLVLVILILLGGFYVYNKEIAPLKTSMQEQVTGFQQAISDTQIALAHQQGVIQQLKTELENDQKQTSRMDVYLSEAEYLIRLAMFNLSFQGNVEIAETLLSAADQKMQAMGTTLSWPVRKALASDIADLKAVPTVDLPGVISELSALSHQVESLPRSSEPSEELVALPVSEAQPDLGWKEKLNKTTDRVTEILSGLFVVSYDAPEAAPLLPPDQYTYVTLNIQSKLDMAQWAVIHTQPEVYQKSLSQVKEWVLRYFSASNTQTKAFVRQLDALMDINVRPALPNLSDSLRQILLAIEQQDQATHQTEIEPHISKQVEIEVEEEAPAENKTQKSEQNGLI